MNFGTAYGHWQLVIINTLIMFPFLAFIYVRLAKREEREAQQHLGEVYIRYARFVPRFLPHLRKTRPGCPPPDAERSTT